MRTIAALLALGLLSSCASGPTEIVLQIDGIRTEDGSLRRDGLDELQIHVTGVSNSFERQESLDLTSRWLPATAPILHRGGPLGIYRIEVIGLLAGDPVISVARDEVFEQGRSRSIAIVLEAACYEVDCGSGETCISGLCSPIPRTTPVDGGTNPLDSGIDASPDDVGGDGGADTEPRVDTGPRVDSGVPGDDWFGPLCAAASRCDESCTGGCVCDSDPCAVRCASGCTVDCKNGHPCSVELAAGNSTVICDGSCDVVVRDGATVDAECKNDSPCVFRCEAGSTCTVDCTGDDARCRIECAAGATCTLMGCEEGTDVMGQVHRCRAE